MIHQIPELGVIAIGCAAGRVALLTMNQMKRGNPPLSGFRVDWILPLLSQDRRSVRPETPLMGFAVSPVQGHSNPDEYGEGEDTDQNATRSSTSLGTRKYRIMLVYTDHTVLSYEIGRSSGAVGCEVDGRTILL